MRVRRRLAHVGEAELEDHGGAQETQEADPEKELPVSGDGQRIKDQAQIFELLRNVSFAAASRSPHGPVYPVYPVHPRHYSFL
ncbi:Hypothetical protein SMAX5B_006171 [Scophthalmus maximus]|uniref:Uncharacterized protein n=1 Tax=Scophthalmus maximus TaxID=52904 RepID=A0A2U9BJC6_SCOMX|nr:Hypothetical protein SMAX5B_006171 [Scophthalmus maximus]